MNTSALGRRLTSAVLAATLLLLPVASIAQTQVKMPKNKYKVQDDVQLGNQSAAQIEQQFPLIRDAKAAAYIERVGQRLVDAIPQEFRQPAFQYRFKWVNARDINAFALPGGPMYINRGMIDNAKNEGEMAGVMAHEVSHVVLRHGTAQATKQSSVTSTLGQLGMVLGGAILGGETGAQLGQMGAQAWMTKYSRDYETQADILGARIMASAGYDPRDLANMFRTIAGQGSSGMPTWLSTHPDPGNRFEKINKEAQMLAVNGTPIKVTPDFERTRAQFRSMPPAPTMAEIEKNPGRYGDGGHGQGTGGGQATGAGGRYSPNIPAPSTSLQNFTEVSWMQVSLPSNWVARKSDNGVEFAPEGAYGDQGITHGIMLGVSQAQGSLDQATAAYLKEILQGNAYLKQQGNPQQGKLANRNAFAHVLAGQSPITGKTEVVSIYTMQLKGGQLFSAITVVPQDQAQAYQSAFRSVLTSLKLNDQ